MGSGRGRGRGGGECWLAREAALAARFL